MPSLETSFFDRLKGGAQCAPPFFTFFKFSPRMRIRYHRLPTSSPLRNERRPFYADSFRIVLCLDGFMQV